MDGFELHSLVKSATPDMIDEMVKEVLKKMFSRKYVYIQVHDYLKSLKDAILTEKPNDNLIRYVNAYEALIYGKQGTKAKTA